LRKKFPAAASGGATSVANDDEDDVDLFGDSDGEEVNVLAFQISIILDIFLMFYFRTQRQ
jgi:hypothetical protein